MNPIRISIVIPNYNSGKYLAQTLDSIFSQDYKDVEVVVADGYSTDNSLEVLAQYQTKHPNLIVHQTTTEGAVDHINYGIAMATGDIVLWLCADDTLAPGCLRTVAKVFENPAVQWVYGKVKIIDRDGKETRGLVTRLKELLQPRYSYQALQCASFIAEPSVFMRRRFCRRVGEYDRRLPLVADYDYWLRAGLLCSPVFVDRHLANWRAHDGSTSVRNTEEQMVEAYRVQRRYSGKWMMPMQWVLCRIAIGMYKIVR